MEDEIKSIIVLIADPKLIKGTSLGLDCGRVTSVVFKALESSVKL